MSNHRKRPQAQKQRYQPKTVKVSRDMRAPRYERAEFRGEFQRGGW